MRSRQYMFVEKKQKEMKIFKNSIEKDGMYEALHTRRKEQRAKQLTLSSCLSADLTNAATRVSQWL